ncbi:acyltransferase [Pelagibacteraceae bacterium]|nr:acyltransferase [Pelagibacteraceae bacterium]
MKNNQTIEYRPEIDGLRALAVIPVMLFHSGLNTFAGGYVGVDIFFVISGYLITSIILSQMNNENFSLLKFYERRARRILPALIFVCLTTIPLAYLLMTPDMYKEFGKQLIAVQIFLSNFYFWNEINYFSPSVDLNPLIHSWSLAVEEQFYLFFPIFLLFFYRFGTKITIILISLIIIVSLLFAQFSGNLKLEYPFIQSNFSWYSPSSLSSFYLPFARAWELLIGSLIAFFLLKNNTKTSNFVNDVLCILGLIFILISIFFFSPNTPFPSIFTTLPVIGTGMIIIFSSNSDLSKKIFSNSFLVKIGLISFSAYLWHQPIFAFLRLKDSSELNFTYIIISFIISFGLAFLTWKFLEQPFRNAKIISSKALILILSTSSIIVIVAGINIYLNNGYIDRYTDTEKILLNPPKNTEVCKINR